MLCFVVFLSSLACSCANIARSKGFTYFGLQFFGECWSGVKPNTGYDNDGNASPKGCVGQNLTMPCEDAHPVCVGKGKRNYVYKLVTPTPEPGKLLVAVCICQSVQEQGVFKAL